MAKHLTPGQKAQLEAALTLRQHELDLRTANHQGHQTRADHARDVLTSDADDAPQRDSDREIDLAMTDRELDELGQISRALTRIKGEGYGYCTDCGSAIPFDRLRLQPHAMRCVTCEARREG